MILTRAEQLVLLKQLTETAERLQAEIEMRKRRLADPTNVESWQVPQEIKLRARAQGGLLYRRQDRQDS
jgi:hypothetical protein